MGDTKYTNGDKVLSTCLICNEPYEQAEKIGDWIKCGGCGHTWRLQIKATDSNLDPKGDSDE